MIGALISLPSPSSPVLYEAGPLTLRYHGLLIALGIIVGTWLTAHELERRGYGGILAPVALFFVVPTGIAGARAYHVVTEYDRYAERLSSVVKFWDGGLGIFGAVAGGFVGLLIFCWLRSVNVLSFADAAAPGLVLAQAIGRWGNYFNQELFGRPSDLHWAIFIAPENRPVEYADATSFHPTFLYESVWDLLVCLVLLWVARRFAVSLKDGDVFLLYVSLYSAGRFVVETFRVDEVLLVAGYIRVNVLVSAVLAIGFFLILLLRHRRAVRSHSQDAHLT